VLLLQLVLLHLLLLLQSLLLLSCPAAGAAEQATFERMACLYVVRLKALTLERCAQNPQDERLHDATADVSPTVS
jgi:hypothetical protein